MYTQRSAQAWYDLRLLLPAWNSPPIRGAFNMGTLNMTKSTPISTGRLASIITLTYDSRKLFCNS